MIRDITLGQYFPGASFLHKMDPRAKILLLVIYVVTLFLAESVAATLKKLRTAESELRKCRREILFTAAQE